MSQEGIAVVIIKCSGVESTEGFTSKKINRGLAVRCFECANTANKSPFRILGDG